MDSQAILPPSDTEDVQECAGFIVGPSGRVVNDISHQTYTHIASPRLCTGFIQHALADLTPFSISARIRTAHNASRPLTRCGLDAGRVTSRSSRLPVLPRA